MSNRRRYFMRQKNHCIFWKNFPLPCKEKSFQNSKYTEHQPNKMKGKNYAAKQHPFRTDTSYA
jgi:hypothetical protein